MSQVESNPARMSNGNALPYWTPEEEEKAVRKVDWSLITILIFALFTVQLDSSNISATLTSTITEDLHITTNQINTGTQVFLAGVVVFELPSTLLLSVIFCWGLIATFQAFINNYSELLATRFLLGFFEAGFVPGGIVLLTTFYKRSEFSTRVSLYYIGKNLASALAGLLAAGILTLEGKTALAGWRWIFIIEGLITILAAVTFLLFLPLSVSRCRPLVGMNRWSYVNKHEQQVLVDRLALDRQINGVVQAKPTVKEVVLSLMNYKLWLHIGITMTCTAALHPLLVYTPKMIKTFGFTTVQANAMTSVGSFANILMTLFLAWCSERLNKRGIFVLIAASWSVIAWSCLTMLGDVDTRWQRYAILTLANVCGTTTHILNSGWLLYNTKSTTAWAVYSAMIVIAANLGGLAGGQLFVSSDVPYYHNGSITVAGLGAGSWGLVAVLIAVYQFDTYRTRKLAAPPAAVEEEDVTEVKIEKTD